MNEVQYMIHESKYTCVKSGQKLSKTQKKNWPIFFFCVSGSLQVLQETNVSHVSHKKCCQHPQRNGYSVVTSDSCSTIAIVDGSRERKKLYRNVLGFQCTMNMSRSRLLKFLTLKFLGIDTEFRVIEDQHFEIKEFWGMERRMQMMTHFFPQVTRK